MDDNNTAPVTPVEGGDGQAQTEVVETQATTTPQDPQVSFEDRQRAFYEKKGWDSEKGNQQLLESYEQLESKLGNYKEIEDKARMFDDQGLTTEQFQSLRQKAQAYDDTQSYIEEQKMQHGLETGELDNLTVQQLTKLWEAGQLSLADIPPARQAEVQRYFNSSQAQEERVHESQARELGEKYPEVFGDAELTNMVATLIEQGTDPNKAAQLVQTKLRASEQKGEQKVRAEIEKLKNGGLERTSSGATTVPNIKTKSVRDAYLYAQQKLANN